MSDTTDPQAEDFSAFMQTEAPEAPEPDEQEAPEEAQPDADDNDVEEVDDEQPEAGDDEADDTDDAEAEEDDAPDEPETYTVRVDGEEVSVSLDELKRSYSGEASIKRRISEVAAQKREAETVYQALQAEQQRLSEFANQVQQKGFLPQPKAPDPALAQKDPVGYTQAFARYNAETQAYQAQQQQFQQMQEQQHRASEAAMRAHLQDQMTQLQSRIPEFSKPETAAKTQERLMRVGQDYGFSADELMGVTDARTIQVLYDAAKYREFQEGKAKAKQAPAPRHVKPKARRAEPPQLARGKLIAKATATQSDADWLNVFTESKEP